MSIAFHKVYHGQAGESIGLYELTVESGCYQEGKSMFKSAVQLCVTSLESAGKFSGACFSPD